MENRHSIPAENSPLVSVVMPVYNCEKYVGQAIDSILRQDYAHIELILIDDGSTDGSKAVMQSRSDSRVRLISNDGNKGIVYSRNRGIDEARGKYIAIMDSDDLVHPSKVRKQVSFLEEHPDYGFCATHFERIGPDDAKLSECRIPANDKEARSHLILENFFCHSSIMFPADILREFRFNTAFNLVEDYELFYRIARTHDIGVLTEILTSYRVHPNNISRVKRDQMQEKVKLLNRRILADLNILFTEEELTMHVDLLYYVSEAFNTSPKLRQLQGWVEKLLEHLKRMPAYNTTLNREIILEKWLVACRNNRQYRKLLIGTLPFQYPYTHLRILRTKITRKKHSA